jgi:uncharacterized protein YutE (UPF0331/DUF86 family)
MDAARLKRYKEKMELISKRTDEIDEWESEFLEDEKTQLACYKAFQESTEAAMDILAMLAKDSGSIPKDDYSNIDFAVEKRIVTKKTGGSLKEANGLRNRFVHHYNGLVTRQAYESLLKLLPVFEQFIEEVEKWLQKV